MRAITTGYIKVDDAFQPHIPRGGGCHRLNMLVNLMASSKDAMPWSSSPSSRTGPSVTRTSGTIVFLDPEVAGVGLNEQDCIAQGIPPHRTAHRLRLPRARHRHAPNEGFFKLIVTDDDEIEVH